MKKPSFAKLLRQLRMDAKLSQKELARRAGLHPSHLNHFESGRRYPSYPILVRLAHALGGSLEIFSENVQTAID